MHYLKCSKYNIVCLINVTSIFKYLLNVVISELRVKKLDHILSFGSNEQFRMLKISIVLHR